MPLQSTFGWNKSSSLLSQIKFLSNGWESWFSFEPMRKFLDLNVNNRRVLRKWPSVSYRRYYLICRQERWNEICIQIGHGSTLLTPAIYPASSRGKWFGFGDTGMHVRCFISLEQEFSCFYFYFCFFFRFGFIFLYGLVSSSYENINSFSPSVINSVNLVNVLGPQNTYERLAVAYRRRGGGRSEDIACDD